MDIVSILKEFMGNEARSCSMGIWMCDTSKCLSNVFLGGGSSRMGIQRKDSCNYVGKELLVYDTRRTLASTMANCHGLYGSQQKAAIKVRRRRERHEELVEAPAEAFECRGIESGET